MDTKALIVQYSDETKTLPDGSKVIYAESDDKIVLYHKIPFEKGITYVYKRDDNTITVNNSPGTNDDKRSMIQLGTYFLKNSKEEDLVTVNVKGDK
ncbi:MAG: hypothetical protein CMP39_07195 [Rickettsiales bacterium]|nr:hypothetical protein [Rickettsiales bacterium]|tara:strand:- start:116 stop:403 length:288 start_codon:yes stop_codon:yes gene_type:complete